MVTSSRRLSSRPPMMMMMWTVTVLPCHGGRRTLTLVEYLIRSTWRLAWLPRVSLSHPTTARLTLIDWELSTSPVDVHSSCCWRGTLSRDVRASSSKVFQLWTLSHQLQSSLIHRPITTQHRQTPPQVSTPPPRHAQPIRGQPVSTMWRNRDALGGCNSLALWQTVGVA